jgi:hypothetical protein
VGSTVDAVTSRAAIVAEARAVRRIRSVITAAA